MSLLAETPELFAPSTTADLARFLADNARGAKRPVYPVGGNTALDCGYPIRDPGIELSLTGLDKLIEYPARDMTVTVEAGISFERLAAILATERQRLPIDVANAEHATLGGIVATDASGPRRYGLGTLRDYVIGISAIDAAGREFKAGGRVVKNVAGYDLCKLLIGSLGTLAVITQVTLKLRPIPDNSAGLWVSFGSLAELEPVLARLMTSDARPVVLEVIEPRAAARIAADSGCELPTGSPALCVVVEGSDHETAWELETLSRELSTFRPQQITRLMHEQVEPLISAMTAFPAAVEPSLVFQANLLPSKTMEFLQTANAAGISLIAHAGNGIVVGHFPSEMTTAEAAERLLTPLRELAVRSRGNLVVSKCPPKWKAQLPVFGKAAPAWTLMRRLKSELDPADLLNRGRLWS